MQTAPIERTARKGTKPVPTKDVDIEQVLYLVDKMTQAGEDCWQLLTDAAHQKEGDADKIRWDQCDIAAKVAKRYGADSTAKFAVDTNIPVRRAREYKTMGLFYSDRGSRAEFLSEHENISYSHLRTAARKFKTTDRAYSFCDRASRRGWSVDKCEYFLARVERIFGDKPAEPPAPPPPIVDAVPCRIMSVANGCVILQLTDGDVTQALWRLWDKGQGKDLLLTLERAVKP